MIWIKVDVPVKAVNVNLLEAVTELLPGGWELWLICFVHWQFYWSCKKRMFYVCIGDWRGGGVLGLGNVRASRGTWPGWVTDRRGVLVGPMPWGHQEGPAPPDEGQARERWGAASGSAMAIAVRAESSRVVASKLEPRSHFGCCAPALLGYPLWLLSKLPNWS